MARKDSVTLSPKYGLNPAMLQCPVCHKDMGIALLGKLKGDVEAPRIMEGDLCDDCKKVWTVILEAQGAHDHPALTGRRGYIKKEALAPSFRSHDTLLMDSMEFEKLVAGTKEG